MESLLFGKAEKTKPNGVLCWFFPMPNFTDDPIYGAQDKVMKIALSYLFEIWR